MVTIIRREERIYQIDTGYACAGIIIDKHGIVYDAAPIFLWMIGKSMCEIKQWKHIRKIMVINE